MAKEAPTFSVTVDTSTGGGNDLSNDILSLDFATPRNVQDVTGVDKSAVERLLLLADHTVTLNGVFNDATTKSHDTFRTIPSTSVTRTVAVVTSGQTLTSEMLLTDYQLSRAQTAELTWTVPGALQNGTVPTWT